MTDISITAANVVSGSDARTVAGVAGEAITAGQALYKAAATGRWMKADADAATAEAREAKGISLNGASTGQPVNVQTSGKITIGGTLTPGIAYYLSGTAGGICPVADVGTGEYVDLIGMATTAAVLDLEFNYTAVSN